MTRKAKASYHAPNLTEHGTIRAVTNTNPRGRGRADNVEMGTYIT